MARHSAPNTIKLLKGEKNKNRLNDDFIDVDKITEIPDCPEWMTEDGIDLFNKYCTALISVNLFTDLDVWALQDLAQLQSYCNNCWLVDGRPAASVYISLVHTMRASFGLNGLAREKIKPQAKEQNSRWSDRKK